MSQENRWYDQLTGERVQATWLKRAVLGLLLSNVVLGVSLLFSLLKGPSIVGLSEDRSTKLRPPTQAVIETEIERGIKSYLNYRHKWDPKTASTQMQRALEYVSSPLRKKFAEVVNKQLDQITSKNVSQKFYVERLEVDQTTGTALVVAERIYQIGENRAATPLVLKIQYEHGRRTDANPEGIYILEDMPAPHS